MNDGPTMRQSIVEFIGRERGQDLFEVALTLPQAIPGDQIATPNLTDSVAKFLSLQAAPEMTEGQAHAVLCLRDFARAAIEVLYPESYGPRRRMLTSFVAAYLSEDGTRCRQAVGFIDRCFKGPTDLSETPAIIEASDLFGGVRAFMRALEADLHGVGAEVFKK